MTVKDLIEEIDNTLVNNPLSMAELVAELEAKHDTPTRGHDSRHADGRASDRD